MRAGLETLVNELDRPPPIPNAADHPLLCVSQQAWDDAHPRLRHLLSRSGRQRRVVFVEAAVPTAGPPRIDFEPKDGLVVATPYLPRGLTGDEGDALLRSLLDGVVRELHLGGFFLWHDSPRALSACRHLKPAAVIYYDCADGPRTPHDGEDLLREEALRRADAVFVDAPGRYLARDLGARAHLLPNGVDAPHFTRARDGGPDPADQRDIPGRRLGFYGPLDDIDVDLLVAVADLRSDYHIILLDHGSGPDRPRLPRRPNIHELGRKAYAELPAYLAGWDVALLPYGHEAARRRIQPTQTLEYLAAGKPVVSTPIRDVINPYAIQGLVAIADQPEDFVIAVACELHRGDRRRWLQRVDSCLRGSSWDHTWTAMEAVLAGLASSACGAST
ncbi:glycosyltransferase [Nannocystis bainbridge]|uniref:Glycosyltransferase n=1 Tax=Nannocystis bainbridge TaxID=2995303 RepID=A0ABT5EAD1_9BACT|nr:glycosyltransferase [Nannocystis bainbridge]MDC0722797.1 glycosyltransferase [Nannocystis bainbridge]